MILKQDILLSLFLPPCLFNGGSRAGAGFGGAPPEGDTNGTPPARAGAWAPAYLFVRLPLYTYVCWVSHAINHINLRRKTRETYKDRIAYSIIN